MKFEVVLYEQAQIDLAKLAKSEPKATTMTNNGY
jgi:hypothetical protein